jgi:hypothetical protein
MQSMQILYRKQSTQKYLPIYFEWVLQTVFLAKHFSKSGS